MTANLSTYLPQDRRRTLARGDYLPDRTTGTALFADISGFTALTEQLRHTLGSRRGIEALTSQINAVYTALIAEIERYGGSVISFAGDAMMCWFDDKEEGRGAKDEQPQTAACAVACGLAMQAAMTRFPELGLKIAIATGPARRFVVGDPQIHYVDTLAGAVVSRAAAGEQLTNKGELLLDKATFKLLGTALTVAKWREDSATGERFAVIAHLAGTVALPALPEIPVLEPAQLQAWLHQPIYKREVAGQGSFLTEFRPCVVLFVRFVGIDYDSDEAGMKLDTFIRQLQQVTARYEGALLQLIMGDKGSYAYVNFGALQAHEDNGRRAVKAALSLREVTPLALQMGIAQGVMRVGAYGGATRRTYGALGDDVNLAARLMAQAVPGEIMVSERVQSAAADFAFVAHPAVQFKGKAQPVPVFAVVGEQKRRAIRLQEPAYALPMVGRQAELQQIEDKLALAAAGQSQIIGIVAEAGLGKSRLVAEVIRAARQKGFAGYGGACQSDAISTPYQAWKTVWGAFFGVDHELPLTQQLRFIEAEIEERAPARMDAMPLLNVVLDLHIPENEFTKTLEPQIRQSALHALLEECLQATSKDEPLLIVIEDLHWIDALSHDLLEQLAQALAHYPVCFVLAYRPPQIARLEAPRLEALAQFTQIELHELTQTEAESAIRAKLAQLYPARGGSLPAGLTETLMTRAQGNPFYLEELLNYVRDQGLDPADIQNIELPDSLHTLILSRIDQLSEGEKTTLRVASIVGRLFRAKWLTGYYPELGAFAQVQAALDALGALDITPQDSSEPEWTYLFKHIVTHEVTYESLPFATRARLHERLAVYLENTYAEALPLEALAFHYGRSDNQAKQMEYLRQAGEAAQKNFANAAALDYYGALLPLLTDAQEKAHIHLQRGQVQELLGQWAEAESDYLAALELSKADAAREADAQFALGKLHHVRGDYAPALAWLAQAQATRAQLADKAMLAQVLIETGWVLVRQGNYAEARERLNAGLAQAQEAGDRLNAAQALNNLAVVARNQGDYAAARALYEESLSLRRELGNKPGIAAVLNSLGFVARDQGDYAAARALYEESLSLKREMGDKRGIATSLNSLGFVARDQGEYTASQALYEESLSLKREMGDKRGIAISLNSLGVVAYTQAGDYAVKRALFEESLSRWRELGDKWGIVVSLNNLGTVALAQGDTAAARASQEESLRLSREIGDKSGAAYARLGLGLVDLAENKPEGRAHILDSLRLRVEMGEQLQQTSSLVGVAGLALQAGDAAGAARWLGAVESALKSLNAAMEVEVKQLHAQTVAAVQVQLGEAAFQQAWDEGAQWTLAETMAYALEETAVSA